jgi:hypothetical protein
VDKRKATAGDTVTENLICEKVKYLYADLVSKLPCTSTEKEGFKASRGWFDNFKRRSGIHSVVRHGEAASSDVKAGEAFIAEFQELIDSECYLPQQVFNCEKNAKADIHHRGRECNARSQAHERPSHPLVLC